MKNIFNYIIPAVLFVPVIASAQFGEIDTFFNETSLFISDTLIPILLAVSFLLFIIGVAQFFFIANGDNADEKEKGKTLMLWGAIAFVVIVSIWGIVMLVAGGLGLNDDSLKSIPVVPI